MDVVYARGTASASQVLDGLPAPPSRTAVRTLLRILEEKGHLKHKKEGREFFYRPTRPRDNAGRSAFRRILHTFFDGSLEKAVSLHLSDPKARFTQEELKRLDDLIHQARNRRP